MNRPKLSRTELGALIASHGIKEQVYIVGIRGYFKDTMGKPGVNDIAIYDDAFFIVSPETFISFNGNTDPSKQYPNIATLKPGLYYYHQGLHGVSGAHPYMAFRQHSDVTVMRQGGKDETDSPAHRFWIDIHRGGYNTTSSLGCQTIHPDQWEEFKGVGYSQMDKYHQPLIPYLLIEQI